MRNRLWSNASIRSRAVWLALLIGGALLAGNFLVGNKEKDDGSNDSNPNVAFEEADPGPRDEMADPGPVESVTAGPHILELDDDQSDKVAPAKFEPADNGSAKVEAAQFEPDSAGGDPAA